LSLVVLSAVPLGIIGAVLGLAVTRNHFGFTAALGLSSLGGIVTNHTIVLFEYAKREMTHGVSMEEALIAAGTKRLRPIFLTVVTSIAGLFPLAFSSQTLWKPFCWVVIFGLAGSMLMTLVVIPTIYKLVAGTRSGIDEHNSKGGDLELSHASGVAVRVTAALAITMLLTFEAGRFRAEAHTLRHIGRAASASKPGLPPSSALATASGGNERALTLMQSINLALGNNLAFRSAATDVRTNEARVIEAGAGHFPTLDIGDSQQHNQSAETVTFPLPGPNGSVSPITVPFTAADANQANVTLRYAIYTGGGVQAAVGQAAAALAASRNSLEAVRANVMRDVTTQYFALVSARQANIVASESLDDARQNEQLAEELLRAGTVPRDDLLKQQTALANAKTQLIRADNAVSLANASLASTLNIDLDSTIDPVEPLRSDLPFPSLEEMLRSAQRTRREVAAAVNAIAIADNAVRSARAGTLPNVSLQTGETDTHPSPFRVPEPQFSAALFATWRVFDGGLTRGRIAEAQTQVDKAKLAVAQLRNDVDLEVRQAYYSYVSARSIVATTGAAQTSADEDLRLSRLRFRAGAGTAFELTDAFTSDAQARTAAVTALANVRAAFAVLQRAAGLLGYHDQR
jgi:outer membrane protein TolC